MKKVVKFSRTKKMLPLRVWGIDYPFDRDMVMSLVDSASVSDPIWSHYPLIRSATPNSLVASPDDLVVSPREAGGYCRPQRIDGHSNQYRFTQKLHGVDSFEVAHALLAGAFEDATKICGKARFLTPAQLLSAAISRGVDDDSPTSPPIVTKNGYLSIDLSEASSRSQSVTKALLYLYRDLAYRSRHVEPIPLKRQIATSGRAEVAGRPPLPYSSTDPQLDLGQSVAPELRHV